MALHKHSPCPTEFTAAPTAPQRSCSEPWHLGQYRICLRKSVHAERTFDRASSRRSRCDARSMLQFIRCDERRPEWASACRSVRYAPLAESEALAVPGSEYVRYLGRTGGVGVLTCVATGDGSCFFPEVRLCVQEAAVSSTEEKETSSRTFVTDTRPPCLWPLGQHFCRPNARS